KIHVGRPSFYTVCYKQVLYPIIVKIGKQRAPAPVGSRYAVHQTNFAKGFTISKIFLQAVARILVLKAALHNFLFVLVVRFIAHIGFQSVFIGREHIGGNNIQLPVVIEIRHIVSHAEPAVMVKMLATRFSKSAVMVVDVVIIVFVKVIADVNIFPSVIIQIPHGHAEAVAQCAAVYTSLLCHINKVAIVIQVKPAARKLINLSAQAGIAVGVHRMIGLVQQKTVELPIVVIVKKSSLG